MKKDKDADYYYNTVCYDLLKSGKYNLAKTMLERFLDKIEEKRFFKGNLLWLVPGSITQNEKSEFINLGYDLGYKNVDLLPTSVAGLQQLEVEYDNPYSHLLVNIGGGATDVSVVYKGKVIQGCLVDIGGEVIDNQIQKFLIEITSDRIPDILKILPRQQYIVLGSTSCLSLYGYVSVIAERLQLLQHFREIDHSLTYHRLAADLSRIGGNASVLAVYIAHVFSKYVDCIDGVSVSVHNNVGGIKIYV